MILSVRATPTIFFVSNVESDVTEEGHATLVVSFLHGGRNSATLGHNFVKQGKLLCNRMTRDVNISLHLSSKNSANRYRIVRYEELASNTLMFARKIFEFTGIDFALEVKEWLRRNRLFDKNESNAGERSYSTSNRNISVTLNSWRKSLSHLKTSVIDKECAYLMHNFGYKFIDKS